MKNDTDLPLPVFQLCFHNPILIHRRVCIYVCIHVSVWVCLWMWGMVFKDFGFERATLSHTFYAICNAIESPPLLSLVPLNTMACTESLRSLLTISELPLQSIEKTQLKLNVMGNIASEWADEMGSLRMRRTEIDWEWWRKVVCRK